MGLKNNNEKFDTIGDNHIGTSSETPMRSDAFKLNTDEKIDIIKDDVRHIMETLGLDLSDDSLKGTPNRVAKMFVNEIFGGLDPQKNQKHPLLKTNISTAKCWLKKTSPSTRLVNTTFLPIVGRAHVAYISNGTVVGLSKMNRIVDLFF